MFALGGSRPVTLAAEHWIESRAPVISGGFFGAVFTFPPNVQMISENIDATRDDCLVVRPNCSASWRTAKLFFAAMCGASLTVAIGFTFMGYWPILPFAGLELIALGAAFYLCQTRAEMVEVISRQGDRVAVEKGRGQPTERWDFDRHWVQVALLRSRIAGHPSQLVLRSHGRQVPVGEFLREDERARAHVPDPVVQHVAVKRRAALHAPRFHDVSERPIVVKLPGRQDDRDQGSVALNGSLEAGVGQ